MTPSPWASLEVSLGDGQAVGVRLVTRVPSSTELGAMLDTLRPAPLERFDAVPTARSARSSDAWTPRP